MKEKGIIRITSQKKGDLSTKLNHNGSEYYITTDIEGKDKYIIKTSVYNEGRLLKTVSKRLTETPEDITLEMEKQHQSVVEQLKKNCLFFDDIYSVVSEAGHLIAQEKYKEAEEMVRLCLKENPNEPLLSSCYAFIVAKLGDIENGLKRCQYALKKALKTNQLNLHIATIYLNLGKIHLLNNDKRSAIRAFKTGLGYDPDNINIKKELAALGIRKRPVMPFLSRSHPINKYLGLLRERFIYKKKK